MTVFDQKVKTASARLAREHLVTSKTSGTGERHVKPPHEAVKRSLCSPRINRHLDRCVNVLHLLHGGIFAVDVQHYHRWRYRDGLARSKKGGVKAGTREQDCSEEAREVLYLWPHSFHVGLHTNPVLRSRTERAGEAAASNR